MANWILYMFGPVNFQVWPVSPQRVSQKNSTDWSRKEIAGAEIYREWVGENDEEIRMNGTIFPHFIARETALNTSIPGRTRTNTLTNTPGLTSGGVSELDVLNNMRKLGQAHLLIRGILPANILGWYVIEQLNRDHTLLAEDGVGQKIEFEIIFQRVPVPVAEDYYPAIWSVTPPGVGPE